MRLISFREEEVQEEEDVDSGSEGVPPTNDECDSVAPRGFSPKTGMKRPAYDDLDDPEVGGTMEPQKKLCRFYFLDECSRADQCYFMHADFPCKFYYFGYECRDGKQCRLRHGKALDDEMKRILWRHVTTAQANLMQRFPCFPSALLRKNFEDRHQELLQMEQEGLLDEDLGAELSESISDTLLGEVIKTVAINQMIDEKLGDLGEMTGVISAEQIATLAKTGIKTKDQLFQLGASSMMELGFDYDTIINIGNFKESHRKQSMYEEDKGVVEEVPSNLDVFSAELGLSQSLPEPPLAVPALSDQELLSILNEEQDAATTAETAAAKEVTPQESHNTSLATTLEGSFTTDFSDSSGEKGQNGTTGGCLQFVLLFFLYISNSKLLGTRKAFPASGRKNQVPKRNIKTAIALNVTPSLCCYCSSLMNLPFLSIFITLIIFNYNCGSCVIVSNVCRMDDHIFFKGLPSI